MSKTLWGNFITFLMLLCLSTSLSLANSEDLSRQNPIERAYRAGEIDKETYVAQKLKSYFSPHELNSAFKTMRSDTEVKATREITHLLIYARKHFSSFSPEDQAYLTMFFARPDSANNTDIDFGIWYLPAPVSTFEPSGVDYPNTAGKFKFWYVTHNTPDGGGHVHQTTGAFVRSVAAFFEHVYSKEVVDLGYPPAPGDGGKPDNGGDAKYDIYLMNCGQKKIYGYVSPVDWADSTNAYYSFMVIDNDFKEFSPTTPDNAARVTAAHEYHHSIQMGINIDASGWYYEATSTWMEDEVYDAVDDNLQYLDDFFQWPEISLDDDTELHEYGAWIWNEFLETEWGVGAIKSVWDNLDPVGKNNAVDAASAMLTARGSSLKAAFTEFAVKNYSKTGFYKGAANEEYIDVWIEDETFLDLTNPKITEQTVNIDHLASKYYKFIPVSTVLGISTLSIKVDGTDGRDLNAAAVAKISDNSYREYFFTLDTPDKSGWINVPDFLSGDITEVVLVLVNHSKNTADDNLELKYFAVIPAVEVYEFVTRFYQLCLGREPDGAGLNGWVNVLSDGNQTGADVSRGFIFSTEFIARNTTNEEYLDILYQAFFDRSPDAAGRQGWLNAMNSGASREDILNGFIYASEFAILCEAFGIKAFEGHVTKAQRDAVKNFVTRFYQLCLGRDPDAAGLEGWTNNLLNQTQTGADVANGFNYSQEFINMNTGNDEYLNILYEAFFNRAPDSAGKALWLAELNAGKDRGHVLNGFLGSQEFINLCENYGITPF